MPRSPSRDLVDRYAGNRGYFHRADRLRQWKNGVALAFTGLTLGWVALELAFPARAAQYHTHGELANPHAAFDDNCQACHVAHGVKDFASNPLSVFRTRDRWHDLTCTKCHAGPAHHATAGDGGEFHRRCSNCHHDHQGRDASLVHISDDHCTRCHTNLAAHSSQPTAYANTVSGFVKDHPEFKVLRDNPPGQEYADRRLKFSHALHMTPGLVYDANDQHKWTPAELGKQFGADVGKRYETAGRATSDPVALTCASCHQLDTADSRNDGAYYLPVSFEQHCKACHPVRAPAATSGGVVLSEFPVPHRVQPAALKPLLRGEYASRLATPKNPALAAPLGPGGRLDPAEAPAVKTFGTDLDRVTDNALKTLLLGITPAGEKPTAKADAFRGPSGGYSCGKCHYATNPGAKPEEVQVAALPNRGVWFEHAMFNHVSHRGLTCASCHPGTEAAFAPGGAVTEREPVLINGVKTCQACHAPAGTKVDLPNGQTAAAAGIRHACTDCHRYHHGDSPLRGRGSPARDPAAPLDLADFLRGGK